MSASSGTTDRHRRLDESRRRFVDHAGRALGQRDLSIPHAVSFVDRHVTARRHLVAVRDRTPG